MVKESRHQERILISVCDESKSLEEPPRYAHMRYEVLEVRFGQTSGKHRIGITIVGLDRLRLADKQCQGAA